MIKYGLALRIADKDLEGVSLPKWWWGFAYREFNVRYTVLYPIPINLVVRYALKLYWLIYRWVAIGGWRAKLDDIYRQGYNDGNTTREHHYEQLARIIMGKE